MVFSSVTFLCVFLPIVFLLYCIVPSLKAKNMILIAASLLFYAYGEPVYVLLMIASSLFNYIFAIIIGKTAKHFVKKVAVIAAITINIGMLGIFKYSGFAVESVNAITGASFPVPQITLPIGISFFTFQALSYVIDVYRDDAKAERSFFNILLYISFFPQLIAGPIVKFHDINAALSERRQTFDGVTSGLRRFICGLGKKVIIANVMGQTADRMFSLEGSELNTALAWLGAIAYMLQIYYDFSGYSDMAIGLGKMFGFTFKENFNYPYTAVNIRDFWRRWHISMSTWFKEYLYIPLGGNRKGKARTAINRLIVFFCTGLWHGANWTFILWGLYHGAFLLFETYVPAVKKLPKIVGRMYSLIVVCVGFVMFRADNVSQGVRFIGKMFSGFSFTPINNAVLLSELTPWFIFIFAVAVIGAVFMQGPSLKIREYISGDTESVRGTVLRITVSVLSLFLLVWCIIRLSGQGYNPFIYFRF